MENKTTTGNLTIQEILEKKEEILTVQRQTLAYLETLNLKEHSLNMREAALEKRKEELAKRKEELAKRKEELEKRKARFKEIEEQLILKEASEMEYWEEHSIF